MSDSTIYPDGTVDSVGENMSDSTIYPDDTVDSVGGNMSDSTIYTDSTVNSVGGNMSDSTIYTDSTVNSVGKNISDCKIYPADTVDAYGNVWPTVGENIRNGIFGLKIKTGKITLNKLVITSQDVEVSVMSNTKFLVNKPIIFLFPISCSEGDISLRFSYGYDKQSRITSFVDLSPVVGEIEIIYAEV